MIWPTDYPNSELKLGPIPKYADHMALEEFIADCECGMFIDYDGHGYFATETEESNIQVVPSDVYD